MTCHYYHCVRHKQQNVFKVNTFSWSLMSQHIIAYSIHFVLAPHCCSEHESNLSATSISRLYNLLLIQIFKQHPSVSHGIIRFTAGGHKVFVWSAFLLHKPNLLSQETSSFFNPWFRRNHQCWSSHTNQKCFSITKRICLQQMPHIVLLHWCNSKHRGLHHCSKPHQRFAEQVVPLGLAHHPSRWLLTWSKFWLLFGRSTLPWRCVHHGLRAWNSTHFGSSQFPCPT